MFINVVSLSFVAFLLIKLYIQFDLFFKNKAHIVDNKEVVPQDFSDIVSLEDHRKAADYSIVKSTFSMFSLVFNTCLLLFWTIFGGFNWLDSLMSGIFQLPMIQQGLVFIAAYSLISTIISLPFAYYQTFIIEQDFGFNKTDMKTFIGDTIKSLFVGAIIGLPFIGLILWIIEKTGMFWWAYAWAAFTTFQFILIWAYPRIIAPLFNKFSPLEEGELKSTIESLLTRCGFESNGLFVMDASKRSSHGNAYFTGFGKSKRIVFFDTLLKHLTPKEAEAVLAHELGHFKHKHVLKNMIRSIVFSFIGFAILGALSNWIIFFDAFKIDYPTPYMALILFMSIVPVYTFLLTPIFSKLSRKDEFQADEFAANHSNAQDMINALKKLFKENASTLTPSPEFSEFYYSHPPAIERVQHLKKFQS